MKLEKQIDYELYQNIISQKVLHQVLQDKIQIECLDTLKSLIKIYPNEPTLYRMYANSLAKNKIFNASAKIYARAAELYLTKGNILSSILTLAISRQANGLELIEVKKFFVKLCNCKNNKPSSIFFISISFEAFVELIDNLKIIQLPKAFVISKVGDPEDKIYFIVSGEIKDSLYLTIDNHEKVYRKPTINLSEGDYFGSIYPFDVQAKTKSYIETKTNSELFWLSKSYLRKLCLKHPNLESSLMYLLGVRSMEDNAKVDSQIRNEKRIFLNLEFELEILFGTAAKSSINVKCHSNDVSIGGICLILENLTVSSDNEVPDVTKLLKNADVFVNSKVEDLIIKLPGKVRWLKPIIDKGKKTLAVGVKFNQISPMLKGLLLSIFNCFTLCSNKIVTDDVMKSSIMEN
jgi:CRP-like cAMP-binding protein